MLNPAAGGDGARVTTKAGTSSPSLRRRNQVTRTTLRELNQAHCLDCREQWINPAAFLDASRHVREAGHRVIVTELQIRQYEPGGGTR